MHFTPKIGDEVRIENSLHVWTVGYIMNWDIYKHDPVLCLTTPVAKDLEFHVYDHTSNVKYECVVEWEKSEWSSNDYDSLKQSRRMDLQVYSKMFWLDLLDFVDYGLPKLATRYDEALPARYQAIERGYYKERISKIRQLIVAL